MAKEIVILGTAYPYRGGLAAYNERLARQFQQEGHIVHIYTFTLQYPSILFPGKTQYADWQAPTDLKIEEAVNSINPLNWLKVGKKIKKMKPDILIVKYWLPFMGPCFGTIARIVKRNKHTKIVSILDNIVPHEKRLGDKFLTKYFVKPIDAFVAMSKSVLSDLSIFNENKPRKLYPHPLFDNFGTALEKNTAKNNLSLDRSFNYLLFFGIIRAYKGLDLIIKAFSLFDYKKMSVKLLIAGEFYEDKEPYLRLIKESMLEDHILLHDKFVPDADVANYFCAADMIVQPYKSATQSGVTQIGFHFEKPMLVTKVGGLDEVIHHKTIGYAVDPSPQEIADCITDFYENDRESIFVKNTAIEKEKYSWSGMTETIFNLLKALEK